MRALFSSLHRRTVAPSLRSKYPRRFAYFALGLGTGYVVDEQYNASAVVRNLRTLWTCAAITLDYKLNFTPEKSDEIPQLHERVAERVFNLLTSNGGLYIKIGQAIGANAAVLPEPMQVKFASLFDDAPQIPYSVVRKVFEKELGRPPSGPGGIFEIFEEKAVASASIAQVHKAKLWPRPGDTEEKWVAVKVQKPAVAKQTEWDLGAFRIVMWMFENWAFDLPAYFVVDFVSDHLRRELDFIREANNANRTASYIESEPRLKGKVYIPKVYSEYSTKRVLTAEWIEGVRLSDRRAIRRLMGERDSDTPQVSAPIVVASPLLESPYNNSINPVNSTSTLPLNISKPLKGGVHAVMKTMVELFSAQMFDWGWVHCDPHPGNVIIRPNPSHPSLPQLVLIDHGLYVEVPEDFRKEWVALWRGMLEGDFQKVDAVTSNWGMGMPDLVASLTLLRPVILKRGRPIKKGTGDEPQKEPKQPTQYEKSVIMKQRLKGFLKDTDRMPKVLIFLTRNMRMVQGNNQSFGSPVNRVKITGLWASKSLAHSPNATWRERLKEYWHHLVFRFVLLTLDLAFWRSKLVAWVKEKILRKSQGGGFEEELERNMREFAKGSLGIDVGANVFTG
ncbi:ABC1 family domain containing protein [Amanita muscaria]